MRTLPKTADNRRIQKPLSLLGQARSIARFLVDSMPGIDGICLYGSVARGDASEWSDIDLLVIGSNPNTTPARLLKRIRQEYPSARISLLYYFTPDFKEHYKEGALFVAHVLSEGKVLYDKRGILRRLLTQRPVPRVRIADEVQTQLGRLEAYEDTRRFNGNFLFCFAHLYSIGKGIIMLGLAKDGILEFNREQAFRRFAMIHPLLAGEVSKVAEIRPFYSLVTSRKPEQLPFPYKDTDDKVQQVVEAIKTLAHAEI